MGQGTRNQLFTLLEPSDVVTSGNATPTYTPRGRVWASMEWLGGRESGTTGRTSFRFDADYRRDIEYRGALLVTSRWRLGLIGTPRVFELTSPFLDQDGQRRSLTCTGEEVTP